MAKTRKLIVSVVILIIVAAGSFFLGKSSGQKVSSQISVPSQTDQVSLFRSQTATFQGEITKVNKDSLDIKTDSGQSGTLVLSDRVVIYKFKKGASQAESSTNLSSIETGKRVLIILEFSKDQYKVVSISYQPRAAIPPPAGGPTQKK